MQRRGSALAGAEHKQVGDRDHRDVPCFKPFREEFSRSYFLLCLLAACRIKIDLTEDIARGGERQDTGEKGRGVLLAGP
jgi:hypothetical protein